ncbi:hypothetical protein GUITHDRAFT_156504 [Guillardia theta CCMP2712]|uniref:Cytochrome P450 n=1 Tax=Guillardia theta (strain CCMP2712) TaxID=905079 RepID=L1I655_GUITC|nr:hypothetical protein GUITHDRAFT_156504 [Guillardia theta CCMP2712]EKX31726.1 hypothetical protein GUITHDRAFT_156504 [Guillardia theta CCMP2712]|eukprot:XP_005818706.1 hypothetical protein GUITHDRAFT_156504 [Guillardia theta CCMP2712]
MLTSLRSKAVIISVSCLATSTLISLLYDVLRRSKIYSADLEKEKKGKRIPYLTSFLKLDLQNLRKALREGGEVVWLLCFHKTVGEALRETGGIFAFSSPAGKPFVIVNNEDILKDILVHHVARYKKQHANGILELFRKTTLPNSQSPAWRPVHKLASRMCFHSVEKEQKLLSLVDELCVMIKKEEDNRKVNLSALLTDWYWKVTLFLVLGEVPQGFPDAYRDAWLACIDRLSSPLINSFFFYKFIPTPANLWYRYTTWKFRKMMMKKMDDDNKCDWSVVHMMLQDKELNLETSEDRLEVAMEFLFTGTTSVTSTISWLMWHLSDNIKLQDKVAQECIGYQANSTEESFVRDLNKLQLLEVCLKETLRMYSPIHIGRMCKHDDVAGGYSIPQGADIMTNMWWVHRNEDNWKDPNKFDPNRFLDSSGNIVKPDHYYPFSMGLRGCPGQAVAFYISKLVVIRLLSSFRFSSQSQQEPLFKPSLMLPNTPAEMNLAVAPRGDEGKWSRKISS